MLFLCQVQIAGYPHPRAPHGLAVREKPKLEMQVIVGYHEPPASNSFTPTRYYSEIRPRYI